MFAPERVVTDRSACYFYTSIELPGMGLIEGTWDLRPGAEEYFGHVDFRGKRVLELGTANGFGCFTMERWGAEVVAFDLSPDHPWDVVPFPGLDVRQEIETMKWGISKMNNAFWLAHHAFASRARMVYGTVRDIPAGIGPVDIATACSILLHVRDPFLALQNAARLVRETFIVSDVIPAIEGCKDHIIFRPARRLPHNPIDARFTWWYLPPQTIVDILDLLGFPHARITYHSQLWRNGDKEWMALPFYTVVARREEFPTP